MQKMDIAAVLEKRKLQLALKRVMDIVISGGALLVIWPVLLLIALAIKIDDPGPVFYRQVRVAGTARNSAFSSSAQWLWTPIKKALRLP